MSNIDFLYVLLYAIVAFFVMTYAINRMISYNKKNGIKCNEQDIAVSGFISGFLWPLTIIAVIVITLTKIMIKRST